MLFLLRCSNVDFGHIEAAHPLECSDGEYLSGVEVDESPLQVCYVTSIDAVCVNVSTRGEGCFSFQCSTRSSFVF